jgi:hypothetical protein
VPLVLLPLGDGPGPFHTALKNLIFQLNGKIKLPTDRILSDFLTGKKMADE